MRIFPIALLSALLAWGWASGAPAQGPGPGGGGGRPTPEQMIQRMDQDGDGKISKREFQGPAQRFQALDADGDGHLTLEELRAAGGGPAGGPGGEPGGAQPAAAQFPVIDTHVHIFALSGSRGNTWDDWDGAARTAIAEMDKAGVKTSIILSPPRDQHDPQHTPNLFRIARAHPGRFAVMGGGSTLNPLINGAPKGGQVSEELRRKFEETAEGLLRQGVIGFGEMTALHFSFFEQHPYERTPPDHPLFLLLADIAARHGVPIDFHMEAVTENSEVPRDLHGRSPKNPQDVPENIAAFERLLAHNPKAKIIWVHVGMDTTDQRSPALTRRLLAKYPNLHLSICTPKGQPKKNWLLQQGRGLNPEWKSVIMEFPDRFMIGSDSFYQTSQAIRKMPMNTPGALRILQFLPPRVARMIAHENAARLYKLSAEPAK
ncbi:MAG: amidohydrolase family protein [Nitrospinota bacterium]